MGREDEGSDLWEWETPRGLFLCVGRGNLGTFPCLTDEACSPAAPLPIRQKSIGCLEHSLGTK